MRGLIILTLLLAAAWSGWWVVGTTAQKSAIEGWMEQRRAEGWTAEVDTFEINGFPSRFDSTFADLVLANPDAGWTWQAPDFQILALSYKPNHIIAVWPGTHSFTTASGTTEIVSDLFRGSLVFKPDTALSLNRMQLEITDLKLSGENGWKTTASEASLAFFSSNAPSLPANTYDLYLKALDFTPPAILRDNLEQINTLPEVIPEVIFDAALSFKQPWDRFSFENSGQQLQALKIRRLRFAWGDLELLGEGSLNVTTDGTLNGDFTLKVRQWRALLDVIITTNLLTPETQTALERGLTFISVLAGNPENLDIPLRFADGLSYIGTIPVGVAPKVY